MGKRLVPCVPGKYKQFMVFLIFSLVLSLGLSGCGEDPQQGLPGGAAPAVVELWHSLKGPEAEALDQQVQRIMAGHPEVIVLLEYIPENKMADYAFQAQAGGEGPDIFLVASETLTALFQQGALAPVLGTTDAFPGLAAQFQYGENSYAQPLVTDLPLFYYRTDLAQPPASLQDLTKDKAVLALSALDTRTLSAWWSSQGGTITNSNQPALDATANLLFLQQLFAWREAKLLVVDPGAWLQFVNGQAAYTISWAGQARGLNGSIPWGSSLLTQLTGGQGQILTGRTLGIANSSIKTTEVSRPLIQLVESELLTSKNQWELGQAGSRFPASSSFYNQEEAQTGILPQVGQGLAKAWALKGNAPEWKLIPVQDKAWQKAWSGVAPESALLEAQTEGLNILNPKQP